MNALILKLKRRETPFWAWLYHFIQAIRKGGFPTISVIHAPLYLITRSLIVIRWQLQEKLWSIPLFRTQCIECGSRLSLPNGLPWLTQGHLRITVGDDVTIMKTNFLAGHAYDHPELTIGNNSTIGYETTISIGQKVEIGDNVMIAHHCYIADNDGHPLDPARRERHEAITPEEVSPIKIGNNVWIGTGSIILKGSEIGDNTVISPNSVISGKVLPNKVMMGVPARAIKALK